MADDPSAQADPPRKVTRVTPGGVTPARPSLVPKAQPDAESGLFERDFAVQEQRHQSVKRSLVWYYVAVLTLLAGMFLVMTALTGTFEQVRGDAGGTPVLTAVQAGAGILLALTGVQLYARVTRGRR